MRPPGFRRLFPEKQRDMSIFNDREFAVLAFAPNRVSGCVINYLKGHWEVLRHGVEPVNSTDPAAAWKQLLRRLGNGIPSERLDFDWQLKTEHAEQPGGAAHFRGAFAALDRRFGTGALAAT